MFEETTSRRNFLYAAAGMAAAAPALLHADLVRKPVKRLKKAVKYPMIQEGDTVEQKLRLAKEVGFDGVEMDSPDDDVDRNEVVRAIEKTGVVVHGVVISNHWVIRHSDPDPKVREQALGYLKQALRDCAYYGGDTVLLVPGVVDDEVTFEQCWERSKANVEEAIPLAESLGVQITIEVVGNNFITTPDQFIEYVDQFESPWVRCYYDSSNMLRHGLTSGEWIRRIGRRMSKFDYKARDENFRSVPIGEGIEDWQDIRAAMEEVGYWGWVTAEVRGGGRKRLREISTKTNKHVLGL